MASAKTHLKLGLFAILAIAAVIVLAFGLGVQVMRQETSKYHSYFDESVQGLEIGSPVKYRGVSIGTVSAITIAPDRRHVDVELSLEQTEASKLGLEHRMPELRAQLGTQGITGVKFVNIDFFDPKAMPPPKLDFEPAPNTIPTAPSLFKGLEDSLRVVLDKLPGLIDLAIASLGNIEVILKDLQGEQVPARIGVAFDNVNTAVTELRGLVRHVDRASIPEKTAKAMDDLDATILKLNAVIDGIGGDAGLLASTQRATESVGDLGRSTASQTEDLEHTLRNLNEAVQAIRDLAQSIGRDPDMLLKGRAKEKHP